jgi:hypothetical protein
MSELQTANPDEYNGWVNRETWAAALHLSSDEGLHLHCLQLVEGKQRWSAADHIEKYVTEQVEIILFPRAVERKFISDSGSVWRNFICGVGSLWRVNWADVADSFLEA